MIQELMQSHWNSTLNGSWGRTRNQILVRLSLDLVGGSVSVSVSPLFAVDSVGCRLWLEGASPNDRDD